MSRSRNQTGASAVEYGLLIAGIAALIVVMVFAFGGLLGIPGAPKAAPKAPPTAKPVVIVSHRLVTACATAKYIMYGAHGGTFKLIKESKVDSSTGATNDDLTNLTLGKVYLAALNDKKQIVSLTPADSTVHPAAC